jgi:3-carboxy-cis,cis-muconate cycloisomerase
MIVMAASRASGAPRRKGPLLPKCAASFALQPHARNTAPDMTTLLGLSPALTANLAIRAIFDDHATLQATLDFEAALARAQAKCGLIPPEAAEIIATCCHAELYDLATISHGAQRAGTLAIPMVKALGEEIRARNPDAASHVHLGATSQDVLDTGLVLQLRTAVSHLLNDAAGLASHLRTLAERHAETPMLGRTLLQPATPVTVGLKAAGWLGAIARGIARLRAAANKALILQYGGAAGTLAVLGTRGVEVTAALGAELRLPVPEAPWHGHRDRLAELAAAAVTLTLSIGKIARDISLLAQFEVAEVAEPGGNGRGGSSTMPHKRNPIASVTALAAATRAPGLLAAVMGAMVSEHERAAGGWQSEAWALGEIMLNLSGALDAMNEATGGLTVDAAVMVANIDRLRGLGFAERLSGALAPRLGRIAAHRRAEQLSEEAVRTGRHLREVAADDKDIAAIVEPRELAALFEPSTYLGCTAEFITATLAAYPAEDALT